MAPKFSTDDILQKECKKIMLDDFFYFLELSEGSTRRLQSSQTTSQLRLSEMK